MQKVYDYIIGMGTPQHLDLRVDPPPDLAIEGDVTHSSLDRMSIYRALGVPEVWRLSKAGLAFQILEAADYQVRANSLSFPALSSAELATFLTQAGQADETALAVRFRSWVRQVLLTRPD